MTLLRRFSYLALVLAFAHLVFGAIVRISGSGMGCGDHWPKCSGVWFPPLTRPDLVIELTHRYLAAVLVFTVGALVLLAWRRRTPGVPGRGGVTRMAVGALAVVIATALFGAITVKLGNAPLATTGHWLLAATLLAMLSATAIRAGGLGGSAALGQRTSLRAARGATAAAIVALFVITLGGLTAKVPGASAACQGFPLCDNAVSATGVQHLQLTHRLVAYLLVLHLVGFAIAATRRGEARVVIIASRVSLGVAALQIVVAAAMVLSHLPPALRSFHQALGAALWLSAFTMAYLARITSGASAVAETLIAIGGAERKVMALRTRPTPEALGTMRHRRLQ